jgi:hypothetical protein
LKKIKSYTSIWSVEKVIYAINDFQLPFPPPHVQSNGMVRGIAVRGDSFWGATALFLD